MSRPLSFAFVCVLLAGVVLGQGVVAAGLGDAAGSPVAESATQSDGARSFSTPQQFDRTRFVFTVYANGSATWTEKHFVGLSNDSARAQFRTFAEEFRTEETKLWTDFKNRSQALTESGGASIERDMSASNFNRSARVNALGNGVVEMSFRWQNFARLSGDRVVVGDIFQGGLYINEDQQLNVETGPSLSVVDSETAPAADDTQTVDGETTVIWYGPRSFGDEQPHVEFTTDDGATGGTGDTQGTTAGAPVANDGGGLLGLVLIGVLVVAIGAGAGIAWRTGMFGGTTSDPDDGAGPAAGSTAAATADEAGTEPDQATTVSEEELLTDEDRVLTLLEDNGGRMKQAKIVDETGWSKSKVSMLLSDMEDEEHISKLRVGRENIISLKGHEPDAAGSPFDDE